MTSMSTDDCQIIDDKDDEEKFSDHDDDQSLSSSTSSDSSNKCPFNPEIASKLSTAFAKATGIDIEFAVQLLKDHGWNVDQALKATYEAKEQAQSLIISTNEHGKNSSDEKYFKILSWNTDSTDSDEVELNDLIEQRTDTIIEILLREKPDVILLQQVGTIALTLIITSLSSLYDDESIQIDSPNNCSYISILTRKSTITKNKATIIPHSDNWKMLQVQVVYKNSVHLELFTAAIDEQTSSFCFEQMHQSHIDHIVLAGISSQICENDWNSTLDDLWEITGKQPETTYTYNPALNSNIGGMENPGRHDRLLFRSMSDRFRPVHMELEGIKHVKTSDDIFPSTHWAIQGYFNVDSYSKHISINEY